jgi:hypothetical protein
MYRQLAVVPTLSVVVRAALPRSHSRRLCCILISLTLFALSSQTSGAELKPGDTVYGLLQDCKIVRPQTDKDLLTDMDLMHFAGCRSYIAGLRDALMVNAAAAQEGKPNLSAICNVPDSLPIDAYVQVFINWADNHPTL